MTLLYYSFFCESLPKSIFDKKLGLVSLAQNLKIRKFKRWQDAHASLFGILMLLRGFREFGLKQTLDDLQYSSYGKPYLDKDPVHFNISHTGSCVACILSTESLNIGIDVEEIRNIEIDDFRNIWRPDEWRRIDNSELRVFYEYWTRKEAIIKAEGKGLSIPLKDIVVDKSLGVYANRFYFLKEIELHGNIVTSIASLHEIDRIKIVRLQPVEI